MPRRRPAAVLVIAILHLIFGGAWLICGVGGLVFGEAIQQMTKQMQAQQKDQQGFDAEEMEKFVQQRIPNAEVGEAIGNVFNIGLAALLVLAGIGLLSMASWGRYLSLFYAVVAIIFQIVTMIVMFTTVMPVINEFFKEEAAKISDPQKRQALEFVGAFAGIGGALGPIIYLIYPLIVLIIMLLPSVARAFRDPHYDAGMAPPLDRYEEGC